MTCYVALKIRNENINQAWVDLTLPKPQTPHLTLWNGNESLDLCRKVVKFFLDHEESLRYSLGSDMEEFGRFCGVTGTLTKLGITTDGIVITGQRVVHLSILDDPAPSRTCQTFNAHDYFHTGEELIGDLVAGNLVHGNGTELTEHNMDIAYTAIII